MARCRRETSAGIVSGTMLPVTRTTACRLCQPPAPDGRHDPGRFEKQQCRAPAKSASGTPFCPTSIRREGAWPRRSVRMPFCTNMRRREFRG